MTMVALPEARAFGFRRDKIPRFCLCSGVRVAMRDRASYLFVFEMEACTMCEESSHILAYDCACEVDVRA